MQNRIKTSIFVFVFGIIGAMMMESACNHFKDIEAVVFLDNATGFPFAIQSERGVELNGKMGGIIHINQATTPGPLQDEYLRVINRWNCKCANINSVVVKRGYLWSEKAVAEFDNILIWQEKNFLKEDFSKRCKIYCD